MIREVFTVDSTYAVRCPVTLSRVEGEGGMDGTREYVGYVCVHL